MEEEERVAFFLHFLAWLRKRFATRKQGFFLQAYVHGAVCVCESLKRFFLGGGGGLLPAFGIASSSSSSSTALICLPKNLPFGTNASSSLPLPIFLHTHLIQGGIEKKNTVFLKNSKISIL